MIGIIAILCAALVWIITAPIIAKAKLDAEADKDSE